MHSSKITWRHRGAHGIDIFKSFGLDGMEKDPSIKMEEMKMH